MLDSKQSFSAGLSEPDWRSGQARQEEGSSFGGAAYARKPARNRPWRKKRKKKEKNGDLVDDPSVFLYKYSCLLPTLAHVTAGH